MEITHRREPSSWLERILARLAGSVARLGRPSFPHDIVWNVDVDIILGGD